jgi:site-specific recombinase XerC
MNEAMALSLLDVLPSWERHARSKRLAERTMYLYRNACERLQGWLVEAGRPTVIDKIDRAALEEYFIAMHTDGLGDYTVAMHYRSLRAVFNWLAREEEIDKTPFLRMHEPKADEQPVPVFTPDELNRLLESCKGKSFEDRRDRAIISLFIDSGPRLGELVALQLADVDLDRGEMLVDGKTGPRKVPIGREAAVDLDRYLRLREKHRQRDLPALWLGRAGAITSSGIAQILKKRGDLAGVENVRPHRFRHTFGHEWRMGGGNEGELMEVAGWKSPEMVRRYGRSAAAERAREAHGRFSPRDRLTS